MALQVMDTEGLDSENPAGDDATPDLTQEPTGSPADVRCTVKSPLLPKVPEADPCATAVDLPQRNDLPAIHFTRLFAAVLIVSFHLCDRGNNAAESNFLTRQNHWVGFFFLLSGFCMAHSRLSRGTASEDTSCENCVPEWKTLLRRIINVYPTYLAAIVLTTIGREGFYSLSGALLHWRVALEMMLGQCWANCHDNCEYLFTDSTMNSPGWFISALTGCWLIENACFNTMRQLQKLSSKAWLFAGIPAVALWQAICPLVHYPWAYDKGSDWPCIYALVSLHIYFSGVMLAFWYHSYELLRTQTWWCASLAMAALMLMSCLDDAAIFWTNNAAVDGCSLLPLHALLIVGLAAGTDPLAKLFAALKGPAFCDASSLSLAVYLLQRPISSLWIRWVTWDPNHPIRKPFLIIHHFPFPTWVFFVMALLTASVTVHCTIQRPVANLVLPLLRKK